MDRFTRRTVLAAASAPSDGAGGGALVDGLFTPPGPGSAGAIGEAGRLADELAGGFGAVTAGVTGPAATIRGLAGSGEDGQAR